MLGGGGDAVILDEADHVFGGIALLGSFEAILPAVLSSVAFVVTEFQSYDTSSVVFTSLFFILAVLFNAFLWRFS